jgi:hypothetical protein
MAIMAIMGVAAKKVNMARGVRFTHVGLVLLVCLAFLSFTRASAIQSVLYNFTDL